MRAPISKPDRVGFVAPFMMGESGMAAVEAAFVLPMLFALTFGLMFFSYVLFVQHEIGEVARQGVRYGMVHGASSASPATASTIETKARAASDFLDATKLTIAVAFAPDNSPGSTVSLQATYQIPIFPFIAHSQNFTISEIDRMTIIQ